MRACAAPRGNGYRGQVGLSVPLLQASHAMHQRRGTKLALAISQQMGKMAREYAGVVQQTDLLEMLNPILCVSTRPK